MVKNSFTTAWNDMKAGKRPMNIHALLNFIANEPEYENSAEKAEFRKIIASIPDGRNNEK